MTICWSCKKACGGCSWSASFEPIKGWRATPTDLKCYSAVRSGSYEVHECPLFEPEEKHEYKQINPDGARELAASVLCLAVSDRRSLVRKRKNAVKDTARKSYRHAIQFLDRVFDSDSLWMSLLGLSSKDVLPALKAQERRGELSRRGPIYAPTRGKGAYRGVQGLTGKGGAE